jgi:hypothetical protein
MRRGLPLLLLGIGLSTGCATARPQLTAEMTPMALSTPAPVTQDHFDRDKHSGISEDALREILAAPVFLEANGRLGVLPVASGYAPEGGLPLPTMPSELSSSLESSGLFEATSELSSDWPTDSGVAGLRELAARYRCDYLLLYRQRFAEDSYTNAWGWLDVTILGALVTPNQTLRVAGVLEATLFDVKTGTLLFTVFERVHKDEYATIWHNDLKTQAMEDQLLEDAAKHLAEQVVGKARRLASLRPAQSNTNTAQTPAPTLNGV